MNGRIILRVIGIIIFALGAITALGFFGFLFIEKFSNPDMTETRLFLTYWKQEIAAVLGIVFAFIGAIIYGATE